MFNRNDPLIGAVQEVMKKNQAERDAIKAVNEKFGITDRRALPHEKQGEWDAAYAKVITEGTEVLNEELSPKQKMLAKLGGNKKKIDAPDLAAARKGHASHIEEENLEEKITGKTDMGTAIKDFQKSDSPQLAGRSKEARRKAAIAAVMQARRKK